VRIVHVANFYGPCSGGIRTAMHALAAQYRARGHEPVLVVPAEDAGVRYVDGVRVVTVPAPPLPASGGYRVVAAPARVRRLLEALAPDRLEVSDRTTLAGLGSWARAAGVPSVLWLHERVDGVLRAFLPGGGPDGRAAALGAAVAPSLADRWNPHTLPRFDRLVATTAFAAGEVERLRAGAPADAAPLPPLHRVPLGVDLALFRPDRYDATERARLAPPGETVVMVASRLSREKRVDLAVDAVARLRAEGRPARLVVAGAGPLLRPLRARAAALGVPARFLSFVPDRVRLATLLACADVVVAPGPVETFGLSALEALASGTPVVCSATSALPEVVGTAGAVAAPRADALAAAVHGVLERPEAARRADARARAERFSWDAAGEAMLRLHGARESGAAAHRGAGAPPVTVARGSR
jgi:alpha-1,6-mannosyltransferase